MVCRYWQCHWICETYSCFLWDEPDLSTKGLWFIPNPPVSSTHEPNLGWKVAKHDFHTRRTTYNELHFVQCERCGATLRIGLGIPRYRKVNVVCENYEDWTVYGNGHFCSLGGFYNHPTTDHYWQNLIWFSSLINVLLWFIGLFHALYWTPWASHYETFIVSPVVLFIGSLLSTMASPLLCLSLMP